MFVCSGDAQIYPLDWTAVQKLFKNFRVTLDGRPRATAGSGGAGTGTGTGAEGGDHGHSSTFNFDHIVSSGVDGWKNLMSFPLIFGSISTFSVTTPSITAPTLTGGSGPNPAPNSAGDHSEQQ
jgi:hypothetical protein